MSGNIKTQRNPVVKKQKGKIVYYVQFTCYEDNYKHRHDNGVYPEKSRLFSTKDKADKFINHELRYYIFGRIHDQEKDIKEDLKDYIADVDNKIELKKEYIDNREVLEKFYKAYCMGEFVDNIFDWRLEELEIE